MNYSPIVTQCLEDIINCHVLVFINTLVLILQQTQDYGINFGTESTESSKVRSVTDRKF